jgi:hypothetical protein
MLAIKFGWQGMKRELTQTTVALEREQREFLEREAAEADRSLSGQIRHVVAQAQEIKAMAALPGDPVTHKNNVQAATLTYQTAMAGTPTAAAARVADIAYHQACLASALATRCSPVPYITALKSLGAAVTSGATSQTSSAAVASVEAAGAAGTVEPAAPAAQSPPAEPVASETPPDSDPAPTSYMRAPDEPDESPPRPRGLHSTPHHRKR